MKSLRRSTCIGTTVLSTTNVVLRIPPGALPAMTVKAVRYRSNENKIFSVASNKRSSCTVAFFEVSSKVPDVEDVAVDKQPVDIESRVVLAIKQCKEAAEQVISHLAEAEFTRVSFTNTRIIL